MLRGLRLMYVVRSGNRCWTRANTYQNTLSIEHHENGVHLPYIFLCPC